MRLQTPDQKKSRQPVFGEVLTELERHRFLYRQRCSNGFVFLQLEVLIIIITPPPPPPEISWLERKALNF
jgi:hypothetical protein